MLVAKPAGPTSHDVVDMVRRALGLRRVGHLGTLDPFAEGLLVVLVGRATRLAPYAAGWAKVYEGVIRLGQTTTTDDCTGAVLAASDTWRGLDADAVRTALERFRGALVQRPPVYSAVKIAGERAYHRARRGEPIAPPERTVEVHRLELASFDPPDALFRAIVGAGTYLRSLARDAGETLGCGAHLAALRRLAVGPFHLGEAVGLDAVTPSVVRDAATLVRDLPRRDLDQAEHEAAVHGRPVAAGSGMRDSGSVALFAGGVLVAVAERAGDVLKPRVVVGER